MATKNVSSKLADTSTLKITVANVTHDGNNAAPAPTTTTKPIAPKSPDAFKAWAPKKSITSMSEDEIIQENLKEILDKKSREERKANGRLVAASLAFLVIFLAIYDAWLRKKAVLTGILVPAGIMLSYGAWVAILAKRSKHKRALIERLKQTQEQQPSGSAATTLHYVNEMMPGAGQRKKPRRHRQRQRGRDNNAADNASEVTVHRSAGKRPSIKQKLFGQAIAHVKLVEVHTDSMEMSESEATTTIDAAAQLINEKRKRLERLDTLAMPQVVRMSSVP